MIDLIANMLFFDAGNIIALKQLLKRLVSTPKFVHEQYEKALAALDRCTAVELRAKRAKIISSGKGKGSKARADTMEDDEVQADLDEAVDAGDGTGDE